ncbi:aldo/keto reductase [Spirochaeta africana]|uniref:Aldo/keto reductase, diketogulonate reductase n=1 Tax=Spirochaeta africana (strain ATCC 700263 / DSM 8902 / Z-7692) TaxID=889378 RepID=H9UJZ4_SPIAZ|nr:aldo/keto reductase [Spirochaeta africana]AFG37837.1 aldo/keto reductase, diketogulonate reductase [Spirochaeta africana DSM 8902]
MKQIELLSGYSIPQLGMGTWQLNGETCSTAVAAAIELGYRHIDTAFAYENHREVAQGIQQAGYPREELFLTTKIPLGKQRPEQIMTFGSRMLDELEVDYVDLLLIHWPDKKVPFAETLSAMKELVDKGSVRSIGISNFNSRITAEAADASPLPVVTNQVEFHPFLYQRELLQVCRERGIVVTAYSPLARGEVVRDERLQKIAERYETNAASVAIAWLMQKGIVVIPKAASTEHLQSNLAAADLEIAPEDIASIDSFEDFRRIINGNFKHYPFDEEM